MNRLQKWAAVGFTAVMLFAGVAMAAPAAFAHGGSDELPAALGISAEEFEAAKEEARVAAINEAAAEGWITDGEAAALIESGRGVRLGHNSYYDGVIDKDAHLAAAIGISTAELEAVKDAVREARLAEAVEEARITAEEAADKTAAYEFKESVDKDAILAEALGISVSELNQARDNNVTYEELLDELGLTEDEVRAARDAAYGAAVEQAVDEGTLSTIQAEELLERGHHHGRGGHSGRGGNGPGSRGDNNGFGEPNVQGAGFNA